MNLDTVIANVLSLMAVRENTLAKTEGCIDNNHG